MHENQPYSSGCPKQGCPNKGGRFIHRFKARVTIYDDSGRATITLFEQAAEELFNVSSEHINVLKSEPNWESNVIAVSQRVIGKRFVFNVKVTSGNFRYISLMYSSGFMADSVEWIPKACTLTLKPSSLPSPLLPEPSSSQLKIKGKKRIHGSSSSSATAATPHTSTSDESDNSC